MSDFTDFMLDLYIHPGTGKSDFNNLIRLILKRKWKQAEKEARNIETSLYMDYAQSIYLQYEDLEPVSEDEETNSEAIDIFWKINSLFEKLREANKKGNKGKANNIRNEIVKRAKELKSAIKRTKYDWEPF